jgi:hypothetical protein
VRRNETIRAQECPEAECTVATSWLSRNGSNAQIFAKESGALIAEGVMRPLDRQHQVHVPTPCGAFLCALSVCALPPIEGAGS